MTLEFSRPGKPTDNGHIESFNGSLRDECLNAHWFTSLADAREKIAAWLKEYNESRPHRALNDLAPLEYLAQLKNEACKLTARVVQESKAPQHRKILTRNLDQFFQARSLVERN